MCDTSVGRELVVSPPCHLPLTPPPTTLHLVPLCSLKSDCVPLPASPPAAGRGRMRQRSVGGGGGLRGAGGGAGGGGRGGGVGGWGVVGSLSPK